MVNPAMKPAKVRLERAFCVQKVLADKLMHSLSGPRWRRVSRSLISGKEVPSPNENSAGGEAAAFKLACLWLQSPQYPVQLNQTL